MACGRLAHFPHMIVRSQRWFPVQEIMVLTVLTFHRFGLIQYNLYSICPSISSSCLSSLFMRKANNDAVSPRRALKCYCRLHSLFLACAVLCLVQISLICLSAAGIVILGSSQCTRGRKNVLMNISE